MELERLQVVIEASLSDFKKKMNAVKGIVNNATSQVKAETDKIKYSMDNMTGKVKTANIDKLKDKIKSVNSDLASMYAKMDEMKSSKHAELSEMPFNESQLDTAVESAMNSDKAYQKLSDSISKTEQELERYNVALSESNALQESTGNGSGRLAGTFDRVKSSLSKAKGHANSFKKNLKGIDLAAIPLSKSIFKLSTMFKLMALRMVMRAAINAIKSGFQDLSKYSTNFNGTMSQINSILLQARNALATAFAPALQALTPIITSVTNAFINAFNTIGMFTARLFGNTATFTKAKQVSTDYAKSLGDTGKAAKKASGALAAFDDINVLNQDSGAGDSGVPDASQMFEEVTIPEENISVIDKFKNKINELIEPLKNISFDNLTNAFGRLKEAISPFTNTIFAGLEWAYFNIFVPLADWTITQVLPVFLDILSGALKILTGIIDALKPVAVWLWDNFLQPLAVWSGGAIVDILDGISYAFNEIAKYISGIQDVIANSDGFLDALVNVGIYLVEGLFNGIISAISGIGSWLWNNLVKPIIDGVKRLFGIASPSTVFADIGKDLIAGILQGLKNTWNTIVVFFNGVLLKLIVFFQSSWQSISEIAANSWKLIKGTWNVAGEWFNSTVIVPIQTFFSGLWDSVKLYAGKAWEGIVGIWQVANTWFEKNVIEPIIKGFKEAINFLIGLAEGFTNGFIKGINAIITALNKISFDIPDWVPVIGGNSFGINIPKVSEIRIPKLATGAVIPPNSEFLAVLGDQKHGKNIEAPESLIRKIVREELSSGQEVTINFAGNMSQLIRVLKPYIDKENNRTGNKLVIGGMPS